MTKQQYAAHYDAAAPDLYRFALLTLGDALLAEQAVASAFVKGYDPDDRASHPAVESWLRLLWDACGASVPQSGWRYCAALRRAGVKEAAPLQELPWNERGMFLLQALFELDEAACADISGLPA